MDGRLRLDQCNPASVRPSETTYPAAVPAISGEKLRSAGLPIPRIIRHLADFVRLKPRRNIIRRNSENRSKNSEKPVGLRNVLQRDTKQSLKVDIPAGAWERDKWEGVGVCLARMSAAGSCRKPPWTGSRRSSLGILHTKQT